ncbi:MAG: YajQ family cyclic di-GMP-binding protein [Magnetococcales bacterium]|nr:YajQ family cyclic di-GMP-binding protein [Magnetococcales bacterium]MBF0322033.1 YajQ family cyclic di-GMP-binding protein [Magnetococcales bacterium]
MPSFDIVSKVDLQEVDNAVNQAAKEIGNRFDFKGSKSKLEREESVIKLISEDEYKLEQIVDILRGKLIRRQVDPQSMDFGKIEPASGGLVRQHITIRQGIDKDLGREIVKRVKESKIKVQVAIQGEEVRVSGKKRDDLQSAIALLRKENLGQPLQFENFRD